MSAAKYTGREAAYIKQELLRAYLEPLFMIVGQREQRIGYIDCSTGPWKKGGWRPGATSAALSLKIMEKCHNELSEKFRRHVRFRGLFIERDKEAFRGLENFLESESWDGIDAHCVRGDFCDLQNEIMAWCGKRDFCLFFIDAAELRHIAVSTLGPFLARPSSEFLINLTFDSILQARSQGNMEEHSKAIFGEAPDISYVDPEEREKFLCGLYRRELKNAAPAMGGAIPRCGHMRVLHPARDRTIYDFVYLTWDPLGLVTFMETSEHLDIEQRKVRALARQSKKIKRSGQLEIFQADRFVEDEPAVDSEKVKEYWLAKLSAVPKQFGVCEFADMLEETGWFMNHFQAAFLELEREGKVRNLASSGMRTGNPVHYWSNGNRGELLEKIEEECPKTR